MREVLRQLRRLRADDRARNGPAFSHKFAAYPELWIVPKAPRRLIGWVFTTDAPPVCYARWVKAHGAAANARYHGLRDVTA